MNNLFSVVLNMSMTGSIVILLVMLARLILKRSPKIFSYALWSVVLFRLLCPVAFTAPVSVLNALEPKVQEASESTSVIYFIPAVVNQNPDFTFVPAENQSGTEPVQVEEPEHTRLDLMTVVPYENPCGAYLYDFVYESNADAPKAYLNFEGVDSCFYLWLNGTFLGYNEVSHSTSEFDVTETIREGKNTLAVMVLKWCDGSYLEDQDKFRTSGIFRDVYILKRPESCIRDYFITTLLDEEEATVRIRFAYNGEFVPTKIKLLNAAEKTVGTGVVKVFDGGAYTHQAVFTVKNPTLWNPEQPYLYTLLLETPDEVITDRIRDMGTEKSRIPMSLPIEAYFVGVGILLEIANFSK